MSSADLSEQSASPLWPVMDGHFIYPRSLDVIRSESGRSLARRLRGLDNGMQVFLRGSRLESEEPFHRADCDLLVVYDSRDQIRELAAVLPSNIIYDIRLIPRARHAENFDVYALLHCRSHQLCGPPMQRTPIAADSDFAWRHWLQYCPAGIPSTLDSRSSHALFHFKSLVRCFGVLSFLREGKFTRDIHTCIAIAGERDPAFAHKLIGLRNSLERAHAATMDVHDILRHLSTEFDSSVGDE